MRIRQGRRNPRNLYLQLSDEPSSDDPCIGFILDPEMAAVLVRIVNGMPVAPPLERP